MLHTVPLALSVATAIQMHVDILGMSVVHLSFKQWQAWHYSTLCMQLHVEFLAGKSALARSCAGEPA